MLQPSRFLFRPLELPRKAGEFLEGIVRAQIDRLTPWSPADAVFGWSKPADAGADRIGITVAATAKNLITPYVQALSSLGVESIAVSTAGPDAAPIRVLDQKAQGGIDVARVRRILIAVLAVTGIADSCYRQRRDNSGGESRLPAGSRGTPYRRTPRPASHAATLSTARPRRNGRWSAASTKRRRA